MTFRAAALLALTACSGSAPPLALSASTADLAADGVSTTTITAKLGDAAATTSIAFHTTAGSFDPQDANVTSLAQDVGGGEASVTLVAPTARADATVTASFDGGSASIVIHFRALLATSLAFRCDAQNIGVTAGVTTTMNCYVSAKDAAGTSIPAARIGFLTEAGTLAFTADSTDAVSGERKLVYTANGNVIGTPDGPLDVDPLGTDGKPATKCACGSDPFTCSSEPCYTAGGKIHNPRDGVVTLLAYVPGTTADGNDTLGEPFLDANDNGMWDPGELCLHEGKRNTNGCVAATNAPSKTVVLWQALRVIWSGDPLTSQTFAGLSASKLTTTFGVASGVTLKLRVVDANLNPLAADANGDAISISADCGSFSPDVASIPFVKSATGMTFAADGAITKPGAGASYGLDTVYPTKAFGTLKFYAPDCATEARVCTLATSLSHTVSPAGEQVQQGMNPIVVTFSAATKCN